LAADWLLIGRWLVADWPLMKESFAGDLYEEPLIMVPYPSPKNADAHNLQPFFERISTAIRAVDEQARP
jgi:hypothetical protein